MAIDHNDTDLPEPPQIRLLRRLVTVLTLTLTFGMIIIVGLMIWRLGPMASTPALPDLPAGLSLPAGEAITGFARNPDWIVIFTRDAGDIQRLHLIRPGEDTPAQTTVITAN